MCKVTTREAFLRAVWQYIPKNPVCIEIGVLYGDFSKLILEILKPKNLILVDPFGIDSGNSSQQKSYGQGQIDTAYSVEQDYNNLISRFEKEIITGQLIIQRNYSHEIVNSFPRSFFDFVYIDACHLYECVKEDLNDWLPKLKLKGLICGHDADQEQVKRAVDEFCIENNFELIIFNPDRGDFALKRK